MSAPEPMTEAELQAAEARANAATPAPWEILDDEFRVKYVLAEYHDENGYPNLAALTIADTSNSDRTKTDAAFIADARTDVPRLIATVRAERARADKLTIERDGLKLQRAALANYIVSHRDDPVLDADTILHDFTDDLAASWYADTFLATIARADAAEAKLARVREALHYDSAEHHADARCSDVCMDSFRARVQAAIAEAAT